jgi:RNA polymerase sigma factor (sigma-70 family)
MGEATFPLVGSRSRALGLRMLRDERLATLAAAGEPQAFAVIYERHHAAIYRYCRSILTDGEDARDALQNTMMNAFRSLASSGKDVALRPWLYRIAHNESISLLRRRREHAELDEATEALGPGVEGGAEANERLGQLVADLRELPEGQRSALVMRELSGLSYGDIAIALTMTPAAAKQQVYEAHSALHQMAEGRAMDCESVRRSISIGDRRVLRGRKLAAHLRACDGCRSFRDAVKARRADLMALAPPLPVGAAAALFSSLFGGGGGAGGGGLLAGGGVAAGGGAAASATGATSGGLWAGLTGGAGSGGGLLAGLTGGGDVVATSAATSAATKALVPVAVTIGVGAGGITLGEDVRRHDPVAPPRPGIQAPRKSEDARSLPKSAPTEELADLAWTTPFESTGTTLEEPLAPIAPAAESPLPPDLAFLAPAAGGPPGAASPAEPEPVPFSSEGEVVQVPAGHEDTVVSEDPLPRQEVPNAGGDVPGTPAPDPSGDGPVLPGVPVGGAPVSPGSAGGDGGSVGTGSPDAEEQPPGQQPAAEPGAGAEPDPDPAPVPQPDPDPGPAPRPDPGPAPEPDPGPAPQPGPVSPGQPGPVSPGQPDPDPAPEPPPGPEPDLLPPIGVEPGAPES